MNSIVARYKPRASSIGHSASRNAFSRSTSCAATEWRQAIRRLSSSAARVSSSASLARVREVAGVALASGGRELRLRVEPLRRVRLDRLEHDDPLHRIAVGRVDLPDQALVEERAEALEGVELLAGRIVETGRHGFDRLDRAAGEDRQDLEEPLLRRTQELVAPLDRRPERLLARGQVAGAAAERLQAAGEPIPKRLRREEVQSGGGELDRERQPVEPAADVGDGGGVVVGEPEVRSDAARPLHEQLDRLELADLIGRQSRRLARPGATGAAPRRRSRRGRGAPGGSSRGS